MRLKISILQRKAFPPARRVVNEPHLPMKLSAIKGRSGAREIGDWGPWK